MTVDYVDVGERLYEVVEHDGPVIRDGETFDFYIDHDAQHIIFNGSLSCCARIAAVARAVSLAWRERSRPQPVPFVGAVS